MNKALKSVTASVLAGAALSVLAPAELFTAAAALHGAATQSGQSLTVRVVDAGSTAGEIWIGLYDSEAAFDDGDEMVSRTIPADADALAGVFEDLPEGQYGVVVFHDRNANGDFDRNFLGIPAERYGFSNNTRPRFRGATWSEARFDVNAEGPGEITVELMGAGG